MTYEAFETSASQGEPVELYEFVYQANYLRYTSAAVPVVLGALTFEPYAMSRDNFKEQAGTFDQTLTITAAKDFPPADYFRLQAPSSVMSLLVRRKHLPDTGPEFIVAWMGRVLGVQWTDSNQVQLTCESDLSSMKRNALRRFYQRGCPWALYGPGCTLNPVTFRETATIFGVSGKTVSVSTFSAFPANYFAGGYIDYINSVTGVQEVIAIRSSLTGDLNLALVPYGLASATELNAYPGCDHTFATCDTKFANRLNYGGQPDIPDVNPMAGTILF